MLTACKQTPENIFLQEWDTPYGTAPFPQITMDQYRPAFDAGLAQQKANIEAIVNNPEAPLSRTPSWLLKKPLPSWKRWKVCSLT